MNEIYAAALHYASLGLPVLPLWHIRDDLNCGCGNAECERSRGKHPMTANGVKDASRDPDVIRQWFDTLPGQPIPNLGGAMGNGLVAIDEDVPGSLLSLGIEIPNGPVQKTGSGGRHYIFKSNGHTLGNLRKFAPGLDCRTDGGLIVLSPSMHLSGHRYEWVTGHALGEVEPGDLPEEIAELTRRTAGNGGADADHDLFNRLRLEALLERLESMPQRRTEGGWRSMMLPLVGAMVARRWPTEAILTACRRATWTDAGYSHADTDAWVREEVARTRARFNVPEPGDENESFNHIDGEPQGHEVRANALAMKKTSWLWYPRIPRSHITLLGARGGSGKGLVGIALAACVTRGRAWPDGTDGPEPGNVIWCETEDPLEEVLIPRLNAAGADRARVIFMDSERFKSIELRERVLRDGVRLIVLSPMVSFLKGLVDDRMNSETAIRAILQDLQASIAGTGCALLGICHTNKKADLAAIDRLLGSVAFANFARSVLLVAPEKDADGCYRLVHGKHNLSIRGADMLYRPEHIGLDPTSQDVRLRWEIAEENADPDAIFDRRKGAKEGSAGSWLVAYLRAHGESLRERVMLDGEKEGHSERAIRGAQSRNPRIKSRQDGFQGPYLWRLEW